MRDVVIEALEALKANKDKEKRQYEPLSEAQRNILAMGEFDVKTGRELAEMSEVEEKVVLLLDEALDNFKRRLRPHLNRAFVEIYKVEMI